MQFGKSCLCFGKQLSVEYSLEQWGTNSEIEMNLMQISELSEASANFYLTGLVIAKGELRTFESRFNGNETATICFTIRDSNRYFINCKVYGTCDFIANCSRAYKIGDVLTVSQPKVSKTVDEYTPKTTSPFQLTVSENRGKIYREAAESHPNLLDLKHKPIKPTSSCLRLRDLATFKPGAKKVIDLMVAVQKVKPVNEVNTKFGKKRVSEVLVMDQTADGVIMTVWNSALVDRTERWIPLQTLLHLVDIECSYSTYCMKTVMQTGRQTIITENPNDTTQANVLLDHLLSLPSSTQTSLAAAQAEAKAIEVNSIKDYMNIRMIKEASAQNRQCAAIVYAVLTRLELNVNSNYFRAYSRYCKHCNRLMDIRKDYCGQERCLLTSVTGNNYVEKFNLKMNLSDHTGTLVDCNMFDAFAEHFLNYSLERFKQLSEDEINEIHQARILERFAAKIIAQPWKNGNTYYKVVELKEIDDFETAARNIIC